MIIHQDFNKLKVNKETSVVEVLKKLNETAKKVLFVVEDDKLLGTVTDGDIRRHILKVGKIEGKVEEFYNPDPVFVYVDELENKEKIEKILLSKKVELIPVVSRDLYLKGYIEWSDIISEDHIISYERIEEDIPVIIMAGGKGTRMKPFTDVLPKPLVPIGEKTIVEHIIDSFKNFGLKRYIMILNYKGKVIESYFNSLEEDYNVEFVYEREFFGTAGGLKLTENIIPQEYFIISNCDIILRCNYKEAFDFHKKNDAIFTSLTSIQHFKIPYGVINTDIGGKVISIKEKPEYTFQINTGVYILNRKIFEYIPDNSYLDMPSLMLKLIEENQKVLSYPIKESDYIDIGQWEEYHKWLKRLEI